MSGALVAATWLLLHAPDGRRVWVNPHSITNFRAPQRADHFAPAGGAGVRCLVFLSDSKYLAVAEDCTVLERQFKD